LPVVLYRHKIWSLTFRKKHRLRVFENTMPRMRFGPKRNGVTGKWRQLHKEEFYDMYSSPNGIQVIKLRRMKWAGHVVHTADRTDAYMVLGGKSEEMRPLGNLGIDRSIILKWIFKKLDGKA
jgi:hypothetical protein